MSYLNWHVGMKVCCVDDRPSPDGLPVPLAAGHIYIISKIRPHKDKIAITLEGVPPMPVRVWDGSVIGSDYNPRRFRPIQIRKTDISIFTAMLNPTEQDKEEIELADFILEHSEVPFQ